MIDLQQSKQELAAAKEERPILRRQLDVLSYWLDMPHWTNAQTSHILVGFLPPFEGSKKRGNYLPGNEPWPEPNRKVWEDKMEKSLAQMDALWRDINRGGVTKPAEILTLAWRKGIRPPWLDAARGDKVCASSPGLSSAIFEESGPDARPEFRKSQKKKRQDQIKNSDTLKVMQTVGFKSFLEHKERRTPEGRSFGECRTLTGKLQNAKIARKVLDDLEDALMGDKKTKRPCLRTTENYVKRWLADQPVDGL